VVVAPGGAREPALAAATAAPAAAGVAALPTQAPVAIAGQQQAAPLKAGEVDDNRDFAAYMDYLHSYSGPRARTIDISERYILTVTNERQQPVLDAHVRLFDGQQQVFEGRTVAGGKTIVLPRALDIAETAGSLRVLIEKGNSSVEGTLTRGQDSTQSFVLRGAEALPATPRLDVLFLLDATGSMGDEIADYKKFSMPKPKAADGGLKGVVLRVDAFGNLITNFRAENLAENAVENGNFQMQVGTHAVNKLVDTYAAGAAGEAIAYIGSSGYIEIGVNKGSAARTLALGRGTPVVLASK
jgi:hypothetical protein